MKNQQQCPERFEERALPAELTRLSPEDRDRLHRLRRQVVRGERSERLPVDRRQDFVRWLIEQGRLSDN